MKKILLFFIFAYHRNYFIMKVIITSDPRTRYIPIQGKVMPFSQGKTMPLSKQQLALKLNQTNSSKPIVVYFLKKK